MIRIRIGINTGSFTIVRTGNTYTLYSPNGIKLFEDTNKYKVLKYAFENIPDYSIIDVVDTRRYRYLKPKYVTGGYSLTDLYFRITKVNRFIVPYDDPNLSIPILDHRFTYSGDIALLSKITVTSGTSLTISDGVARIDGPGEEYYVYRVNTVPASLAIIAEVESFTRNPIIVVAKDANNRLLWLYDSELGTFNSYRVMNGIDY